MTGRWSHHSGGSQIVSATTNGTGSMGGFSNKLSTAEINNVSQYVASFGAVAGVTTTTAPAGSPVSGSTLYMQNCSGCHGLHGEGGPGGAVAGTELSRSGIISVTNAGTSGMPAYGSQLSTIEIAAIADDILGMNGDIGSGEATGDGPAETAAETTTTTASLPENETVAAGVSSPIAFSRQDPAGDGGLSKLTIVAVVVGMLIAGGAAFAWMRAARNLVG